jgi:predicted ArsR family transcriptional regulator
VTKQHISEGLKRFLREQIQTVFRLEVLLLLHRNRDRSLTAADVARELGFDNDLAQQQLTKLVNLELVESNAQERTYRYSPVNAADGSMVDQVAASYSRRRVPILSVILAEHPDRTRLFSEAFRIIRTND